MHMSHRGLTSYSSFAMAAVSGGGGAQRGGVLEEVALGRRRAGVGVGGVRQSAECRAGRERASRSAWTVVWLPPASTKQSWRQLRQVRQVPNGTSSESP